MVSIHSPMTTGIDEIQAAVHTMVLNVPTIQPRFVSQILIILLVDIVYDGLPAERASVGRERAMVGRRGEQRGGR